MKPLLPLLPPAVVIIGILFIVAFIMEVRTDLIRARQVLDALRERRHRRRMEALDKQIELERAKQLAIEDLPEEQESDPQRGEPVPDLDTPTNPKGHP